MEELPNVLWTYRTTARKATKETPFSLVYGSEAVIPAEIGMPTYWVTSFEESSNEDGLKHNLDMLEEKRKIASLREAKYKAVVA